MAFWKRRFWRLYPTYVVAILFTLVASQWFYQQPVLAMNGFGWDLTSHLFLFHNLTDEFSTGLGNGVFWSLGMEEQLYGLYFFLFLLFCRGRYWTVLWVVTTISVMWRLMVPWMMDTKINVGHFHLGSWYHWPFFYCLHWTLGAVAVDAFTGNRPLPRWCESFRVACIIVLPGILLNRVTLEVLSNTRIGQLLLTGINPDSPWIISIQYLSEILITVSFFMMINWSLQLERSGRLPKLLEKLSAPIGRISYSLYLVHIPVLMTLEK